LEGRGVDINNSFELPLDPASAWATLLDIKRIMPCIPGAELLEASEDGATYKGKVSVRLGPIALAFVGTAAFTERDDAARIARLKAKGSDAKGRGGVQADMSFQVAEAGAADSRVTVHTQVTFTGSVAQYGRGTGVIQGVASQLIAQFATNLRASLLATQSTVPAPTATQPAPVAQSTGEPAGGESLGKTTAVGTLSQPPLPAAKPISGFTIMFKALWTAFVGLFRRQPPRADKPDH
jgi:carbon monoxide dehydrogenase subunit G